MAGRVFQTLRVFFGHFTGESEHLRADEFEICPRHQTRDDAAGSGFEETVRGDDDVRYFGCHVVLPDENRLSCSFSD